MRLSSPHRLYSIVIWFSRDESCTGTTTMQFLFTSYEFELRFAQHLGKITEAMLHNQSPMLAYFTKIASTRSSAQRAEAGQAQGFLNMWQDEYNVLMLCLLTDILVVFRRLEKNVPERWSPHHRCLFSEKSCCGEIGDDG